VPLTWLWLAEELIEEGPQLLHCTVSSATLIPALKALLNRIEISFDHCIENRRTTKSGEWNWVNQFRSPGVLCGDRSALPGAANRAPCVYRKPHPVDGVTESPKLAK
jgi:hypothetical protein